MTEAKKKAEEIINEIESLVFWKCTEPPYEATREQLIPLAVNKVKGMIEEYDILIDTRIIFVLEKPETITKVQRISFWKEVLKHLEG